MLEVYACIANDHDLRFVMLAAAICLLSSFTTFALANHIRDLTLSRQFHWVFLTACVTGVGIWSTHFVAMLAYQPNLPTAYSPIGTALSLAVSIIMSGVGWWVNFSDRKHGGIIAVLSITIGIASMHFIGMGAMKTQGRYVYDPMLIACSVAGCGALVAFAMRGGRGHLPRMVQAFAFTLGICLLHFGSMAAVRILPNSGIAIPDVTLSRPFLMLSVASAVLALLAVAVFAATLSVRVKRASDEVVRFMSYDTLTGVLNTSAFDRAFETFLSRRKGTDDQIAVLRIGLACESVTAGAGDRDLADRLLVEAAKKLKACCEDGVVGRTGRAEFTVLLYGDHRYADIGALVRRLHESMSANVYIDGKYIKAEANIGVARHPEHGSDVDDLRRASGLALDRARMTGGGVLFEYNVAMERVAKERHELEEALRSALAGDQLHLVYQPISCVTTGGIVGFEALLRWQHPKLGAISPSEFVPLAEATGLMIEIGNWALVEACRTAATWQQKLKVAVNLSTVQFADPSLVEKVRAALETSSLEPSRLELEITESLLLDDAENAIEVLHEIKRLGVRIAMDDFGTGFSSLSYFRQFPFDKVKIDQSFVRDMIANRQSLAIIRAVIGLGRALDLTVLAEGVETLEQWDVLAMEGCQQVQGYLMGKPATIDHYAGLTSRYDAPSHSCVSRCDECLERLRPPCTAAPTGPSLLITRNGSRTLAA